MKKSEPWYIHAALYVVIAILVYILVKVAIIDPADYIEKETYYRTESQTRMDNIRQAQILWEKQKKHYTDNIDSLIYFVKTDTVVNNLITGIDSLTNRSTNPFKFLSTGEFIADSIKFSPQSGLSYALAVDTSVSIDTVINRTGKIVRVDTNTVMGTLYFVECPDGYGTIGSLESQALKNTASWE
jgi:hypothetical protein